MTAVASPAGTDQRPLPGLRQDLSLLKGAAAEHGSSEWLIYDPLRHSYTQIDGQTFAILSLWKANTTPEALFNAVKHTLGPNVSPEDIAKLAAFLEQNHLTEAVAQSSWKQIDATSKSRRHGALMWLVHNYLFLKIPLWAPEPFLKATMHWVSAFYSRRVQWAIALIGLIGLYLVSREWDAFLLEARGLASLGGAVSIAIVLFFAKALHELGHAYTAIRYGCRVPSLGVAFMMLAPILYTDVTDAWRLTNRRHRLAIDAAGVTVELGLACLATMLWVLLPDGGARHVAFLIATTSWLMSVSINLNPFMKFDGYYMLGDVLLVDNLQQRSFGLGVWKLRETLFGLEAPCPEVLPPRMRWFLIAYAYGVWIFRLVLFTGIALLVYAYFFKALGVALFLFEIGYFIARPVGSEIKQWWTMRNRIHKSPRARTTAAAAAVIVALFFIPWPVRVSVPAILEGDRVIKVFAPRPARVAAVETRVGAQVSVGQLLVRLDAPELDVKQRIAKAKLVAIEIRLGRLSADVEDLSASQVLEGERSALLIELEGLARQRTEFEIRAPATSTVAEFDATLQAGRWINPREPIALLDASLAPRVVGYVSEHDLWRISAGANGSFVPDVPLADVLEVTLAEVGATAASAIEIQELASQNGGMIEAYPDAQQRLIPSTAQYHLRLRPVSGGVIPASSIRGTVYLDAKAESLFRGVWRRVLKVLVRESGV